MMDIFCTGFCIHEQEFLRLCTRSKCLSHKIDMLFFLIYFAALTTSETSENKVTSTHVFIYLELAIVCS